MQKPCLCGRRMNIKLRTVVYRNKVEIDNVPIYSCEDCSRCEVYPAVKPDLTGLIGQLGDKPARQQFRFDDLCELACLMLKLAGSDRLQQTVDLIVGERVNELLDLLLLAQSLSDERWIGDIRSRLQQITSYLQPSRN